MWTSQEVIGLCLDCIANGVKAVSLGGGEPFEYDGVFEIIDALYPKCYLSITSNGIPLLKKETWNELMNHRPDKIHLTIHNPDSTTEVERVINQIKQLQATDIKPGVNLLVGADKIDAAHDAYVTLKQVITSDQIIILPQRFGNTPTPKDLAKVAEGKPFQSPSCLLGCQRPANFVSISWDKKVNSCSYAPNKEDLTSLDFRGLREAISRIKWDSCTNFK